MDIKLKAALISLFLVLSGCATATRSTLLGTAVGGAIGGTLGQGTSHNSSGTAIGAVIGASLGSLLGYLSYKSKKDIKGEQTTTNAEDEFPSLTKPKLRSVWIPDRVEGNKYIRGHWMFVIEDPGAWSKD